MKTDKILQFYTDNKLELGNGLSGVITSEISNQDLLVYLVECLPKRQLFLSGFYLLPADEIESYSKSLDLLSGVVNQYGFLPIGLCMAGSVIAVDKVTGKTYWFPIRHFINGFGTLFDHENKEVEATRENLEKVGVFLSAFNEEFIIHVCYNDFYRLAVILGEA